MRRCSGCGAEQAGLQCGYCGGFGAEDRRSIARADFSAEKPRGWHAGQRMVGRSAGQGRWLLTQEQSHQNHPLLIAPGSYDDFEARLTFAIQSGKTGDGLFFKGRTADGGALSVHYWLPGAVSMGWQKPEGQWQQPLARATPAYDEDARGCFRLRWLAQGRKHRVYLDDALVISLSHPEIVHSGGLELRIQAQYGPLSVEVRELEVLEAPAG